MDAFINVIRKDLEVQIEIFDMLDRYNRLPPKCQSKVGFDTLIQNVILTELLDIINGYNNNRFRLELKMKNSRIEYLESKTDSQIFKSVW